MIYLGNLGVCLQLKAISYNVVSAKNKKQMRVRSCFSWIFRLLFFIGIAVAIPIYRWTGSLCNSQFIYPMGYISLMGIITTYSIVVIIVVNSSSFKIMDESLLKFY
jgi:hypothetical protein